jgi:hypothetical protein
MTKEAVHQTTHSSTYGVQRGVQVQMGSVLTDDYTTSRADPAAESKDPTLTGYYLRTRCFGAQEFLQE